MTDLLGRLKSALAERYRIERELGRGGMALVYLAEDLRHGRKVAIKVLRPELATALGPERFLREIRLTAGLDHPHIVPLLDSGEAGGFLFCVMPYVAGESLRERLTREKQLPIDDALQITREIADALDFAHQHDVIHRDIKPENILLGAGHARVVDFGIARAISAAGGDRLTAGGLAVGTPEYMSPQQATGERDLDGRSDQYALGCVLYEMLAGQPPFTGPTAQAILARQSVQPVPPLRLTRATTPLHVETAVAKALAKVPSDRFATCLEFTRALRADVRPRRARLVLPVAITAALALIGITLFVRGNRLPWMVRPAAAAFFEERDRVIVSQFENEASETSLGLAIREAIVTDLDQSPYVRVVGREEIQEVLERMRLADTVRVGADLALEIARREGYPAVVAGGVMPLGTGYQLSVRIIEAATGRVAVRLRETAASDAEVLDAVERLARLSRRHLGESLASLRRSQPLLSVTTASLDALQLFTRARDHAARGQFSLAISLARDAVELDTAFAAAYRGLGIWYTNNGDPATGQMNIDLAYRHAERLLARERYLIGGAYHAYRGRRDSAAYYYRRAVDQHPDLLAAINNLGDAYEHMGRYEEALTAYRRTVEIGQSLVGHYNLASAARVLGRHALADSTLTAMAERFPGTWMAQVTAVMNAYYGGDFAEMERLATDIAAQPWAHPRAYGRWLLASTRAMHGQVNTALGLADSAVAYSIESGSRSFPYEPMRVAVYAALAAGTPARARLNVDNAPRPSSREGGSRFEYSALGHIANGYALVGDVVAAESILVQMDSLSHAGDFRPGAIGEQVRAVISLHEGRPEESLQHLGRARTAEYGLQHHPARLLLGDSYVALGRLEEAVAQYDSLTSTTGLFYGDMAIYGPLLPVAHERLAMTYLALGDTARAVRHLAAFMELWQDADPQLQPRVQDVKRRLAALVGEPSRAPAR